MNKPKPTDKPDRLVKAPARIVKCIICGEDTTHSINSSFYGSVHRWGPTDHRFVPDRRSF